MLAIGLQHFQTLLARREMIPLKQFGQHFLTDPNLCQAIVDDAALCAGESVLEIGPGLGSLTGFALAKGVRLTAVEIDRGLCGHLREVFGAVENFELVEGDVLDYLSGVGGEKAFDKIIGNLPYNITTPILAAVLQGENLPRECVWMVQREIAERLNAPPRTKAYGAITVLAQLLYDVDVLRNVPRTVFLPPPNVDSIIIRLRRKNNAESGSAAMSSASQRKAFYEFVRKGFLHRRKKLKHTLGLSIDQRAEELSPTDWAQTFATSGKNSAG